MVPFKLLLNSYHSGANAWFALAEERGYYAAEGLDVEIATGNGAYRAPILMEEGGHDATFGDMGSLIRIAADAAPDTAPVAILAVHHTTPSAIGVIADGPILTSADLPGHHIIGHLSDVAMRTFPAYAAKAAIDPATVSTAVSDETMADMLVAMFEGQADGVFGYSSSMRAVLRQRDPALAARLRFLPFPPIVPDLYGSMMMASRRAMETKPEALRALLRALTRSMTDAVRDHQAAIDAVMKRNPALARAIEQDRWRDTIAEEMAHSETAELGFGAVDPRRLAAGAALMAQTVPLARAVPASELFDGGFLPDRAARLALAQACPVYGLV